ncbi:hypothetical protein ElyMa_004323000 [Elysia marginata]|uniref:Uncharacterized protein n=1 Tax=Elysia marginata TaxID=1093978 RepID=A0AAV4H1B2_9GAST|nr:hypothetical protein ElyMa_004323000 [Elysia marginata]
MKAVIKFGSILHRFFSILNFLVDIDDSKCERHSDKHCEDYNNDNDDDNHDNDDDNDDNYDDNNDNDDDNNDIDDTDDGDNNDDDDYECKWFANVGKISIMFVF